MSETVFTICLKLKTTYNNIEIITTHHDVNEFKKKTQILLQIRKNSVLGFPFNFLLYILVSKFQVFI